MKILLKLAFITICLCLLALTGCIEDPVDQMDQDTTPPSITSVDPQNGQTDVSVNTNITIRFSEDINSSTVSSASFSISINGNPATITGTVSAIGDEVVFNPSEELQYGSEYSIALSAGVEDLAGNAAPSATFSFTTEEEPDTVAPTVSSISPENGLTDVSLSSNIEITFSESIDPGSVNDNTVALTTPAFSNNIQAEVSVSGNVMTIDPAVDFEEGAVYTLTLGTGLTDLAGNGLAQEFVSVFTTEILDNVPPSVVDFSVFNGEEGIAVDASITITFSEPMDENSLPDNILFRKIGTTDYLDINFQVTGNDVIVTPAETMKGNVQYALDVTVNVTDLAGNQLDFARGRVFTTAMVPLTLVSMTPSNGATDVEIDEDIVLTFSEDLNASTVSAFFAGSSAPAFNAQVSGNQLTISPDTHWKEFETTLILTISSGLEDVNGNLLSASEVVSFTTVFLSSNYYYTIRNYEDDMYSGEARYLAFQTAMPQVTYSSSVTDEALWSFGNLGNGEYSIKNKFLDLNNFNNEFLGSLPLTTSSGLVYSDFVSTGERWTFESATTNLWLMRSRGNLLDGEFIEMTSDQTTSSGFRWWYLTRDSKIN